MSAFTLIITSGDPGDNDSTWAPNKNSTKQLNYR